jgi:class 3 adenylate cyclase
MLNDQLPPVNYRISADYGKVSIAKSLSSQNEDLFGPAMNICAKINSMAKLNGLVIGKNLFDLVRRLDEYLFIPSDEGLIGDREKYPIYHVREKEERDIINPFERRATT